MFTGLIQEIGTLRALRPSRAGIEWTIAAPDLALRLHPGDSVNVSGACQTVSAIHGDHIVGTAIRETLHVTSFGTWRIGRKVNLEPALSVGDPVGGHWVTGHVDVAGRLRRRLDQSGELRLEIAYPARFDPWVVSKGSIVIDGVSLTIAAHQSGAATVALIPETLARTTLRDLRVGALVNIEFDHLVKAVVRDRPGIDAAMLARAGWE
jgi:riboflavin synthase